MCYISADYLNILVCGEIVTLSSSEQLLLLVPSAGDLRHASLGDQ